ncbi:MAG: signal peptidase I [Oscillospiraceae bacterium]|nr:signal peptidase I [Oscillospiraceae bacterium]
MSKVKIDGKLEPPSLQILEAELERTKYRSRFIKTLRNTVFTLITVAAAAVLVATIWMPVLQIYGNSMTPLLNDGEIVLSLKTSNIKKGEVIAFYYNNKILIKRVIGNAGDWIDINEKGDVYVNGSLLDEPYASEKALGDSNIEYPYQVPEGKVFVMGDHRSVSVDSRNTSVGCVAQEQIVGKLMLKFWPTKNIEKIS